MKKIISATIIALMPVMAFAIAPPEPTVSIESITVSKGIVEATGNAGYTPTDTEVTVDSDGSSVGSSSSNPWGVSFQTRFGQHTLTATLGSAIATANYIVTGGGGILYPLANYCGFLWGAAFSNCSQTIYTRVIPFGHEGCMFAWGCKGN